MSFNTSLKDNILTITLGNKFDFDSIEDFQKTYIDSNAKEYTIDFRNTEYMDSSGLGMLLNMKRKLGENISITLTNCRPQIKKVLVISRFEQKFKLA